MTISSTNRKAGPFIGNDSASVFPFAFSVFSAADVYAVQLNTVTSVETPLALGVDYTVTLNADQSANPGGTLTLTAGPLATGLTLTLTTAVTPLQLTDLTNQGGFYPRVITRAFDKLTVLVQQILERLGRSLTLPLSTPANVSTALPVPEANKALVWNSTATGLANYDASQFATSVIGTNRVVDRFLTNGTAGPYTLSADPLNINNTLVFVGGDYRTHNTYTVSGASITFGTTVANGTVVEVVQQLAVTYPVTALSDNVVSTGKVVDGAITLAKLTTAVQALVNGALQADGSVEMTGPLVLPGDAASDLQAVPKQQMEAAIAGVSGKRIAQVQSYQTGDVATGSGTFNVNAIPQQSGGDQYLSVSITPTNAGSTLLVLVNCFASNSAANNNVVALFKDAAVDALAATSQYQGQAAGFNQLSLQHVMLAGSTDATTFKVRCGGSGAGTTTLNGSAGAGHLGGVACSRITVLEVLP